MGWKSVRKGTNVNEALFLPEKNAGRTGIKTCKSVEQEQNTKKAHVFVRKNPNGKRQLNPNL